LPRRAANLYENLFPAKTPRRKVKMGEKISDAVLSGGFRAEKRFSGNSQ